MTPDESSPSAGWETVRDVMVGSPETARPTTSLDRFTDRDVDAYAPEAAGLSGREAPA